MLTEEQIMEAAGLHSWDQQRHIAAEQIAALAPTIVPEKHAGRRSGRTTRMLVGALQLAQRGAVVLHGMNPGHSELLCKAARQLAKAAGLGNLSGRFISGHPPQYPRVFLHPIVAELQDHAR